jgi:hypothetical protein
MVSAEGGKLRLPPKDSHMSGGRGKISIEEFADAKEKSDEEPIAELLRRVKFGEESERYPKGEPESSATPGRCAIGVPVRGGLNALPDSDQPTNA